MSHPESIDRSVLGCLVAGFEKGGTTLIKDLLVATGRMQSAFEGGLLLAGCPADGIPEPYATQLVQSWRLPADFLERYRGCASFADGYRLLRDQSACCQGDLPLVDKTPRYMTSLADVMRRAPGTPVVIVLRDPPQVAGSWLRLGKSVADAAAAIRISILGTVSTPAELLADVYVLQLADLVADPAGACARLQTWLGRAAVPYSAARHLGTAAPGESLPRGVHADRIAIESHCSPREVAEVTAELTRLLPWFRAVAAVPSGPLVEGLAAARPLWEAVTDEAGLPCTLHSPDILSIAEFRRRRHQGCSGEGSATRSGRSSEADCGARSEAGHAAIPRDVVGCIVTGFVKGGVTRLKNLLVETTDLRIGCAGGLLVAERPADGMSAVARRGRDGIDPAVLGRLRRCTSFEAAYRLVQAAAPPHDRAAPLLDKAPEYLMELDAVMRRAPGTPVVVAIRDPARVLASWLHLGHPLGDAIAWIRTATEMLEQVLADPSRAPSIYTVSLHDLDRDPDAVLAPLHAWLGRQPRGVLPATRWARGSEAEGCDVSPGALDQLRRMLREHVPGASVIAALRSGPAAEVPGRRALAA